jgi:hypothetical protein
MVIASNGDAQISVDFENPLESFCQDSRLASYAQAIEQRRPDSDKKSDVYPYFAEGEFLRVSDAGSGLQLTASVQKKQYMKLYRHPVRMFFG